MSNTATLTDPYPIVPFTTPVHAAVRVPGSKSITNRALLLAALTEQRLTLTNALFSRDTAIMIAALQQLGFDVAADAPAQTIAVTGQGGRIPAATAKLNVGNAGTAARFLTALLALRTDGAYELDGDEAMRRRPIAPLLNALATQGARADADFFPFRVETSGLPGGTIPLDASASSQMLSALLMVAPVASTPVEIVLSGATVSEPFVAMTVAMIKQFGITIAESDDGLRFRVPVGRYHWSDGDSYQVEPDATAASYFLALPAATGGSATVAGVSEDSLQGDIAFAQELRRIGLETIERGPGFTSTKPSHARPAGITADFKAFSDTFLTLAAIAPLLDGPTRISGIAHTRHQETDRVAGMVRELRRLGQQVIEEDDALEIHPQPLPEEAEVETYDDHRFAMSFAILGCHDRRGDGWSWLRIRNPGCCAKTFPRFFEVLEQVRQDSLAAAQ